MTAITFFQRLQDETTSEREYLLTSPVIQQALAGELSLASYTSFLTQAYYHVKHTTPLLMAVGSRLPDSKEWVRDKIAHYIEEEVGHQEWILNDIAVCGADAEAVRHGQPSFATEMMVSYIWDYVARKNPMGFFGMVFVLEGTSVNIATQAADGIREHLGLPQKAFSYLYSHGSLDLEHIDFFAEIVNKIDDVNDQNDILRVAKVIFRLYADIFRSL